MDNRVFPLPLDPHDGIRIGNDVVGVRVWGPPSRPTLSIGAADIWDRRLFNHHQPCITLERIRELAFSDRLHEIARSPNETVYDIYNRYDFPCPKPGAQLILILPFSNETTVEQIDEQAVHLRASGRGKLLDIDVRVLLCERTLVLNCEGADLSGYDLAIRIWRHRDTILPNTPIHPTLGDRVSPSDFDPLPPPDTFERNRSVFGIQQRFPGEMTFPRGYEFAIGASTDIRGVIRHTNDKVGLGTALVAEKEGRLSHGVYKRYTPINESHGSAATLTFREIPKRFSIAAAVATSSDDCDPVDLVTKHLSDIPYESIGELLKQDAEIRRASIREHRALAETTNNDRIEAPDIILPKLRNRRGYYGDVPMCSVDSTKWAFQDSALWHADFHLNEIRAEPLLTMGRFEDVARYADLIRTLLPSTEENAHDIYSLPGAMYPLVHYPLRCRGIAHTNLTWEQDIGLNGLVAKPLWLYWRYTGDRAFLEDVAYPVLRACAVFCAAYLSEGGDEFLHIVPTVSPEHWGLTANFERNRDCTSALTLTKYLFNAAATAATILQTDDNLAEEWRSAAERLVPYPRYQIENGEIWTDVDGAPPIEYNIPVPLSPVFWGDDVGVDSSPEVLAIAHRTLEHINVWEPHRFYLDSCVRPRLGLPSVSDIIGPEHFLLSYQSIRLFPGVADGIGARIENLCAEGGFRVSATRTKSSVVENLTIHSALGETCRIGNPWPNQDIEVRLDGSGTVVSRQHSDVIEFATEVGITYSISPT